MEALKESLLNHISLNGAAFCKYQQRNEEELSVQQRKILAENLLNKSMTMFLNRFGNFIEKDHFKYFDSLVYDDKEKEDMIKGSKKKIDLIKFKFQILILAQIKNLIHAMDHQQTIVRNRRYAAMLKMVKERNSYFSEDEMIRRDPALFEEIVGQYLTIAEKHARKDFDPRSSTLVEILLESIDQQNEDRRKENENLNRIDEDNSQHDMSEDSSHEEQWGNFDGQKGSKERKRKSKYITKGEKEMLKDEWVGIMYNNFISGKDSEFFDYSQIDENEAYDETTENDQDCQDKYFDEDDENSKLSTKSEESSNPNPQNKQVNHESEDELDIYMKHIEGHIKRQNQNAFVEEFDDDEL